MSIFCDNNIQKEAKQKRKIPNYLAIMTPETPVFCLCVSTSLKDRRSPFPEELFKVEKKNITYYFITT